MSRISLFLVALIACGDAPEASKAPEAEAPAARPLPIMFPTPAAKAPSSAPGGTVKETMDSGGYTYALLEACGTEAWIAGPQTPLKVGDTVQITGTMPMHGFRSNTLDRTFDRILFSRAISPSSEAIDCSQGSPLASEAPSAANPHGAPASPHAAPASPHGAPASPHGAPASPHGATPPKATAGMGTSQQGKVLETMESGGYRYARVDFCGTEAWIAGPSTPLEVGQTVATGKHMPMKDFRSSTLGRTFASIDFVNSMKVLPSPPACK